MDELLASPTPSDDNSPLRTYQNTGAVAGPACAEPFDDRYEDLDWTDPELVVFPAFNELLGCTWVNENDGFLAPFLPAALPAGDAYLLDGTRLGGYREV
jgi:metallophosphoesterase superfamily enzyme